MANANAIADQLMKLGLRHGEKAGIAIASMVFFLCVGGAVSRPTIDTSPEQVKKAAEQSESNLNRHEERETIIKNLEEREKITPTNFAGTVEDQIKVTLVPDNYKAARPWVTPEPGAGLIRDKPELIAPSELYAYPGRGGLLVFALDKEGERIPLKEGEEKEEQKQRLGRLKKKKGGGMGGSMGGGMMGGQRKKKKGKAKVEIAREEKEQRELEAKRKANLLAGDVGDTIKSEAAEETANTHEFKEITKGYRWVAITGTLDHGQMLANYRQALKNPAVAYPNYARLEVERKVLQPDGTWTEWQLVDADKNLDILDNIPEADEELTPESVRPKSLVDPLPFLQAGYWEKVHLASLVPREKVVVPEENTNLAMPGMGMSRGGMPNMGQQADMMNQMMRQRGSGMGMGGPGGMRGGGPGGMGPMAGMGEMMGMGGSSEAAGNFWKSDEKKVMIRALDFTVEPDNIYRYRVRVVVFNPNYQREDISPGTDFKSKFLKGPWSKETDPVIMPPDVMPYAIDTLLPPASPISDIKVRFQVVRFHPYDGVTVPNTFDATVGDLIGEFKRKEVPVSDGSGKKLEPIDFTTHQIVLDLSGGGKPLLLPAGLVGPPIDRPVLATVLRPDGSIAVHGQPDDEANEVRKDMEANYHREIEQSSKKRENSQGKGTSDMMQSMMQSMMGGGRRGR
jgi:hypothetical protein